MKVWISTTGARRRRRTALHALRRRPRCCSRLTWGRTHSALKRSPVGVAVHARPPARPSLIMRSQKGGGLRNNPIPTVRTPSLSRVHVRIVVKVLIETFFRLRFCAASAIAVPAASPQLHTSQAAPPWGARFHLSQTPRLRHRDYRKQYCPLQSYINLKQRSIPP